MENEALIHETHQNNLPKPSSSASHNPGQVNYTILQGEHDSDLPKAVPSTSKNLDDNCAILQTGFGGNTFPLKKVLYKGKKLQLVVSKEDFKDLKRWDLSDHKYVIKAIVDNSKPDELPLLQSSLTIIAESLKVIIEDLKKNFVNDLDRSVFITFYHKSFSKWGIPLKPLNLATLNIKNLLSTLTTNVENTLNSYEGLRLDESFHLYVTILGKSHMARIRTKLKKIEDRDTAANSTSSKKNVDPLFDFPIGFGQPNSLTSRCFDKLCCIMSLILGSYNVLNQCEGRLSQELQQKAKTMQKCFSKVPRIQNEGLQCALEEYDLLASKYQELQRNKPQTMRIITPIVCKHYSVQAVFHETAGKDEIAWQYPMELSADLPVVHLHYEERNDGNGDHITLIKNIKSYKDIKGLHCHVCGAKQCGKSYHHKCKNHCLKCHRSIGDMNTNFHKDSRVFYCDSKLRKFKIKPFRCDKGCNSFLSSIDCYKFHKANVCAKDYFCDLCEKIIPVKGSRAKQAQMAELHTCELDAKVCKTCKLEAHGDEKCKLVRRPLDMTVPKLLFAAVSFVDPTPFNCQECYDKDEYCSYHKISYQDCGKQFAYPNYLVTLREKYFHGSFVREDYGHHLLTTDSLQEGPLNMEYKPNGNTETKVSDTLKKGPFGTQPKDYGLDAIRNRIATNPLEKFLQKALSDKSFKNTTIIGSHNFLSHVCQGLKSLRAGTRPELKDKNGNLMRIETLVNGLSFLTIDSYFGERVEPYHNEDGPFFPWNFCHESNYQYSGQVPDLKYFIRPKDRLQVAALKTQYVENFDGDWSFKKELQTTVFSEAYRIMEKAIRLLNFSFEIQDHLRTSLKIELADHVRNGQDQKCDEEEKDESRSIFNIFKNSSNLPGFAYLLMQHYCLSQHDLWSIKAAETGIGAGAKTSRPEYIFQHYMKWKHHNQRLIGSFLSPNGPKKFGRIPVDLYNADTKVVYNFHGKC